MRRSASSPRIMLGIIEDRCARPNEKIGHPLLVDVFKNCQIWSSADRIDDKQYFLTLNELARLLDRFRRTIGIVKRHVVDLAAVDAALLVDHLEVCSRGHRSCRIG